MKCQICKRTLTNPESIADGIGPECAAKYATAVAAAGSSVARVEFLPGPLPLIGSAKVTMLNKVTPLDGRGVLVVVNAEVDLVGKVVQFGRGMIEEISRQLFRQFSACVKQRLEVADESQTATTESRSGEKALPASEMAETKAAPLVLRALWSVVARFFLRLFGKQAA